MARGDEEQSSFVAAVGADGRDDEMAYVETIVGSGEHIVHVGRLSLWTILSSLVGGTFLIVVAIGLLLVPVGSPTITYALAGIAAALGIVVIAVALVRRASTELAVTNRRVIAKFGLIARSTVEMNLGKIESVRVEQTVMGRLLGFGSIIVTGTGATMDPIRYIANPIAFRQAIQQATDALPKA
jgi:uncharacterized membrane protein YdbT with pleckstrin-like domain